MNTRNLVNFLLVTALIGGVAGLLISFFVQAEVYAANLSPFNFMEVIGVVLFNFILGVTFAVVSMTGFFAYLFIHRFGLSLFRGFWSTVQVGLIIFVLFDLVYFPYQAANGEVSLIWYILIALALLAYSWMVAKKKAKETNKHAFIPALFFMIVITTVEWVPALQVEGTEYMWLMIAPLLACNTYQLLKLHRITNKGKKENISAKQNSTSVKMKKVSKA
ncbi:KinB-signaling pathway activation protein [Oceanobacillus piezotolerans]|uniref:KinB-signaling pathway activation protein n=1 Tax=Oceanobacillus piezotolerans TaxID=2448030 RepID=A0A498D2X8_9BACI|nr:KinB-signaling pathway activation protein [Oceanobacillus piezotolerans]RLL39953.1 KinB-signaling pathway activation protein [Oceanobacillus piezotolerans]